MENNLDFTNWKIIQKSIDEINHQHIMSVFTLANGKIGSRGGFFEKTTLKENQAVFMNGYYESEEIQYGENAFGYAKNKQIMLPLPFLSPVEISYNNMPISSTNTNVKQFNRTLDMKTSILESNFDAAIEEVDFKISNKKLVSLSYKNIIAYNLSLSATKDVTINLKLTILNDNEQTDHFDPRKSEGVKSKLKIINNKIKENFTNLAIYSTENSKKEIAIGHKINCCNEIYAYDFGDYCVKLKENEKLNFTIISFYEDDKEKYDEFHTLVQYDFCFFEKQQIKIMKNFWASNNSKIIDFENKTSDAALKFAQLCLFTNAGSDGKTNISAKGLSGEGYGGHYFWDTEIFVLPYFIFTNKNIAKKLIQYRFSILEKAMERANEMSYKGALFPWRTINGYEASAYYPAGTAQIHINADICYSIKLYFDVHDDVEFIKEIGEKILTECTKFYLDYLEDNKDGTFSINMVTGPDEYSALMNNNAYTNYMVNDLFKFIVTLNKIDSNLFHEIVDLVKPIIDNFIIGRQGNLIEQSEGYFKLEKWDFSKRVKLPLLLNYHPMIIYKYQVLKQADLILAMNLLPNDFSKEEKTVNYDYYKKITTHDSSLSTCAYSILAANIGKLEESYEWFNNNINIDLNNTHGNTNDGLHIASQAGTWQIIFFGFFGAKIRDGKLFLKNNVPDSIQNITLNINFKSTPIEIVYENKVIKVISEKEFDSYIQVTN